MRKVIELEQFRSGMEASKEFTGKMMAEFGSAAAEAIEEMEGLKADKRNARAITIPSGGWLNDGTSWYPHYYDIPAEGVTERDRADVAIAPQSVNTVAICGLCPTSETLGGKIRIRSASVPAADIVAEYWIERGKE